jgi:hypothetical protein
MICPNQPKATAIPSSLPMLHPAPIGTKYSSWLAAMTNSRPQKGLYRITIKRMNAMGIVIKRFTI